MKFYTPFLIIPSIFGTFIVLIAVWNRKISVAPSTTALLISVLLVNNLIILAVLCPILYFQESWGLLRLTSKPACQIFHHVIALLPYLQMSCHVLLSLERCIVVTCPLKAKMWITYRRVVIVTCVMVVFLAAVSSTTYFHSRIVRSGNATYCFSGKYAAKEMAFVSLYLNLIFWQTIPLSFMTIANVIIIVALYHRYRRRRVLSGRLGPSQKHTRLTITLVIISVVFSIFTIPTTACMILMGGLTGNFRAPPAWLFRLRWLTFRNTFVADWIILLVLSTRIRRSAWQLLSCCARESNRTSVSATQSNGPQTQGTSCLIENNKGRKSLGGEIQLQRLNPNGDEC